LGLPKTKRIESRTSRTEDSHSLVHNPLANCHVAGIARKAFIKILRICLLFCIFNELQLTMMGYDHGGLKSGQNLSHDDGEHQSSIMKEEISKCAMKHTIALLQPSASLATPLFSSSYDEPELQHPNACFTANPTNG